MDIAIKRYALEDYLEAFKKLLELGSRIFIVRGATPLAINFYRIIKHTYKDIPELEIILSDINTKHSLLGIDIIHPDKAYEEKCDAIFIFTSNNTEKVIEEIYRLEWEPDKVYCSQSRAKTLVVSIPKCGTHLIMEMMNALGYKLKHYLDEPKKIHINSMESDEYVVTHLLTLSNIGVLSLLNEGKLKLIFNFRDPRAAVVSLVNYLCHERYRNIMESQGARSMVLYHVFTSLPDMESRIKFCMSAESSLSLLAPSGPFPAYFTKMAYLLFHPFTHKVRFEKIVGESGGGSVKEQIEEVSRIMRYLNVRGNPTEIGKRVFKRDTQTFFKGQADLWRDSFSKELLDKFDSDYRDILDIYGY